METRVQPRTALHMGSPRTDFVGPPLRSRRCGRQHCADYPLDLDEAHIKLVASLAAQMAFERIVLPHDRTIDGWRRPDKLGNLTPPPSPPLNGRGLRLNGHIGIPRYKFSCDGSLLDALQRRMDLAPYAMRARRRIVEHPFRTIKAWMGNPHLLMKRLKSVKTAIGLHILAPRSIPAVVALN